MGKYFYYALFESCDLYRGIFESCDQYYGEIGREGYSYCVAEQRMTLASDNKLLYLCSLIHLIWIITLDGGVAGGSY